MTSFSCYVIGEGSLTIQCADYLLSSGHRVRGIVTQDAAVVSWSADNGVKVVEPGIDLNDRLETPFDFLFSIVNFRILPEAVLELPEVAAVNFHDGPLPEYAGLNVTSWAIMNEESEHAVTWHLMKARVDGGDILLSRTIPIGPDETSFSLNAKCYEAGYETFKELVANLVAGKLEGRPGDLSERTYYSSAKRPHQGAILDWRQGADQILALVRALDFGPYANLLAAPKCLIGSDLFVVESCVAEAAAADAVPGTVIAADDNELVVATSTGGLRLTLSSDLSGRPARSLDVSPGDRLPLVGSEDAAEIDSTLKEYARFESYWLEALKRPAPLQLPYDTGLLSSHGAFTRFCRDVDLPSLADPLNVNGSPNTLAALLGIVFAKLAGADFTVGVHFGGKNPLGLLADIVPWNVSVDPDARAADQVRSLAQAFGRLQGAGSYARDLPARFPETRALKDHSYRVQIEVNRVAEPRRVRSDTALHLIVTPDGKSCAWHYDETAFSGEDVRRMQSQLDVLIGRLQDAPDSTISELTLLTDDEMELLVRGWNDTDARVPYRCVHEIIEQMVERTPQATALVHHGRSLTYGQMDQEANRLAERLIRQGVTTETLVGIFIDRSIEMVLSCLAVMKAGGAYVPLDPEFPRDRIAFMIEDAEIDHVMTVSDLAGEIPGNVSYVILADEEHQGTGGDSAVRPDVSVNPENLCYVIFTSGSTGRPKGVQLEHRNVVNFFVGMDERIEHDDPGVWLAVTSLSFDISVLEVFWTLARGFEVVIYDGVESAGVDPPPSSKPIDFSLFFFASGEGGEESADKYRLLLDAARFGDENGFAAVWTPERHFHAFGGLYPNPSVASAAVAAITENIHIRAGSCVSPLHSPIRIAEEWSVVDNLSRGRVGISFAAGWQPDDFVLMPDNFSDRKALMFKQIEEVRELWRGGSVTYINGKGREIEVKTLPRPVQDDLPVWITAAGSPETFRMAGERGYNVLTHLLGQSIGELAEKIQVYREARAESGRDPEAGQVTIMLHTFVGEDDEAVKELVRQPMKDYLESSIGLIKLAAWAFPTFRQKTTGQNGEFSVDHLSEEEFDEVLDFSFERYFETSGLFGTVEKCLGTVEELKEIGVTEVACLIDYGVDANLMIEQLPRLDELRRRANDRAVAEPSASFPELVRNRGVTHFQCTPSMAGMLTADQEGLEALGRIGSVMIGGEAFPGSLARRLTAVAPDAILNMYGPTETTIWSSTAPVRADKDVTIGRPIANTTMYVVDRYGKPVPIGVPGELWIGGKGVARGYLKRPDLTAKRFIPDPFRNDESRVYRTGDLVRYREDGSIDFLGRMDYQVKVRGYRIELGEIESVLAEHPGVGEAVAMVRGDVPEDRRIVAYVIAADSTAPSSSEMRAYLAARIPDYMVPTNFVVLDRFPITPNGKVDRKRLPAPLEVADDAGRDVVEPRSALEREMSDIWAQVLQIPKLGVTDNFFDLGGNSLIAVNLVSKVRAQFGVALPLLSLFRSPTIAAMSSLVADLQIQLASDEELEKAISNLSELSDEEVKALLGSEA